MTRKVFISFLGTNNYIQTYYELNGAKTQQPVRFVQEAMIDFLCKNWTESDIILVFRTVDANKKNWLDNGHDRITEEIEKKGLKSILLNKQIKPQIIEDESTEIPDGFSEDEIWGIFDKVYSKLCDEDELYFDITHAFRSIPLFSTVLFNFAKFINNTKLISIHYGAFEKLGTASKVKEMPLEQRIAPIVDITSLVDLQNITTVSSNFVEFGKIGNIGTIFSHSFNDKQLNNRINSIKLNIDKLDGYIVANRMSDIKKGICVEEIRNNLKSIYKSDLPNAIKLVLKRFEKEIVEFEPKESNKNILAAIKWALKYKMLVQAYTMADEFIISLACEKLSLYSPYDNLCNDSDTNFRMYISAILKINKKDVFNKNYQLELKKYENITDEILNLEWVQELRKNYKLLADNRNILNHGKGNISAGDLEKQFTDSYKKSMDILNSLSC